MKKLYNAVKGVVAFGRTARDLHRLDDVFRVAESMDDEANVAEGRAALALDPVGAAALRDRPRLGRLDLVALRALPSGTLGREFAEHMIANGLDPAAIPTLPSRTDAEFIKAAFYETHDIFHVLTGYGTDPNGEMGLQAFYLAQGPARLSALLLGAGLLNLVLQKGAFAERDARLRAIVHGWLLGREARNLFGYRWNELWETPLVELRARLRIDIAAADRLVERGATTEARARIPAPRVVASGAVAASA